MAIPLPPLSSAAMLARGLRLPPPALPAEETPPGTRCAITGEAIPSGYPAQAIIPASTGEWLDLLRGDVHGYLSPEAATCIANDWNLGNRALIERPDGQIDAYYPLLARPKAGAPDGGCDASSGDTGEISARRLKNLGRDGGLSRPCWSDLLREIWPARAGQRCLFLVATDPKKRVWNRARVGTIGAATPFLVFDSSRHLLRVLTVDMDELLPALALVETIYSAGFSKRGIAESLLREGKAIDRLPGGHRQALEWEGALRALRGMDWFPLAVIVAQRAAESMAPAADAATTPRPKPPRAHPTASSSPAPIGGLFDA